VLGRIIETMTGMSWDNALADRLLRPAGLDQTVTLPERALRFRTAVGHSIDPALKISLTDDWSLPRAQAPAGATPCASVGDLLKFARLHLDGGRAQSGERLLSEESVRAMQVPQVALPEQPGGGAAHWGLGWMLFDWDGHRVIGHDGGTIGQVSSLRVLPEQRFAVGVLANTTPSGGLLLDRAVRWLFEEFAHVTRPPRPRPPETPPVLDLSPYTGVYERLSQRLDLALRDGALFVTATMSGALASPSAPQLPPARLYPVSETLFLQHTPFLETFLPVTFSGFEEGRPRYLFAGRVARRTA
jgi:CubicO group peptidase (beta-lactamase class C family)